jgi:hypothetical protein
LILFRDNSHKIQNLTELKMKFNFDPQNGINGFYLNIFFSLNNVTRVNIWTPVTKSTGMRWINGAS